MWLISYVLLLHMVGDLLFQTKTMFEDKWWKPIEMFKHHTIYTLTLLIGLITYPIVNFNFLNIIDYVIVVTMFHILSDSLSSWEAQRSKLKYDIHRIILIRTLDQVLHLIVLFYFLHLLG